MSVVFVSAQLIYTNHLVTRQTKQAEELIQVIKNDVPVCCSDIAQ